MMLLPRTVRMIPVLRVKVIVALMIEYLGSLDISFMRADNENETPFVISLSVPQTLSCRAVSRGMIHSARSTRTTRTSLLSV